MAYVKILRGRNLFAVEEYIFNGRDFDDPVVYNDCTEGSVANQMHVIQHRHGKAKLDAIHIVQSFSSEDSKKLIPEQYTEQGEELVQKMFPGHQFAVVTHTDTDKMHNHIIVNPVNLKTGKRIQNKKRLLYDLRAESDRIALDRGLSIIDKQSRISWENLPEDVQDLISSFSSEPLFIKNAVRIIEGIRAEAVPSD